MSMKVALRRRSAGRELGPARAAPPPTPRLSLVALVNRIHSLNLINA